MTAIPNVMPNVLNNVFNNVNPGVFGRLGPELMLDWDMEQTGPNLVTNGDFKLWTADNPDSWTVTETPPDNIVTRVGDAARMLSDGTIVSINQVATSIGETYDFNITVLDVTTPAVKVASGGTTIGIFNTVGDHEAEFLAAATSVSLFRNGATDTTFTNVRAGLSKSTTWAWTDNNAAVLSKETDGGSGQALRVAYGGTTQPYATQTPGATIGNIYRVKGRARGNGTYLPIIRRASSASIVWSGTSSTSWQDFEEDFTADAAKALLFVANASAAGYVEFDDISLKEIL